MKRDLRLIVFFLLATLVIPVTGFAVVGSAFEDQAAGWIEAMPPGWLLRVGIMGLLAADLALPVPASVLLTYGGQTLGFAETIVFGTIGLTISAEIGYWIGRLGRSTATAPHVRSGRQSSSSVWWIILSRPLPILAEAATVGAGLGGITHRVFLPAVFVANVWVCMIFASLGLMPTTHPWLRLLASAIIPLAVAAAVRKAFQLNVAKAEDGTALDAKQNAPSTTDGK